MYCNPTNRDKKIHEYLLTNCGLSSIIIFVVQEKFSTTNAEVAELADAHGSGPCGSNTLWVRLPSSAGRRKAL